MLAVSVALTLAACAGGSRPPLDTGPRPASPDAGIPPADPPPIASLPRVPEPAPGSAPPGDAQKLIGLRGDNLRTWIGDTVFVRRDGIAEIWRFAAETCFLDVFLYRERDGLRVAHLDARARAGNQRVTPQACYGQLLAERKASKTS